MRKTRVKVKNRDTGKTSTIKVPADIAEQWTKSGGLPGFVGSFNNAISYIEKQLNTAKGSVDAKGYIILKIDGPGIND